MRISWKQSSMFWFYWVIAFVSPGELSAWLPPSTYPPLHPPTLYSVFTHSNAMHTPPPTVMQCNACHPPNCTSSTYQRSTQHCAVFSSHPPHHCTLQCTVKLSILWTPAQHWNCTSQPMMHCMEKSLLDYSSVSESLQKYSIHWHYGAVESWPAAPATKCGGWSFGPPTQLVKAGMVPLGPP